MDDNKPSDAFYPGRAPGEIRRPQQSKIDVQPDDPRLGVPADKFGTFTIPMITPDRRQAVVMMIYPPEELRDQPLDVIRAVIARTSAGILESVAMEIYKSFTSEPVDATTARVIGEALVNHADASRRG